MSGFEVAGLALAAPAVVQQLLRTSLEGYRIFNDVKDCGKSIHRHQIDLEFQRVQLNDWIKIVADNGGNLSVLLEKDKYNLALNLLVHIADVFANVEILGKKYGIQRNPIGSNAGSLAVERVKDVTSESASLMSGKRSRLGMKRVISSAKSIFRSDKDKRSSQTQLTPSFGASNESSPSAVTHFAKGKSISSSTVLRETVQALGASEKALVSLPHSVEVTLQEHEVELVANCYQEAISTFRQYEWVLSGRAELERLVSDLGNYNEKLHCLIRHLKTLQGLTNMTCFKEFKIPLKLPFAQNTVFLGRAEVIDQIQSNLKFAEGSALRREIVIVGMGGLGKSQIVLEYAYRYQSQYSGVFWLDVRNSTTVDSSALRVFDQIVEHYSAKYPGKTDYALVAQDLGIPGQLDPGTGQLSSTATRSPSEIVKAWLAREHNSNWLFIADNYDNPGSLSAEDFLPSCGHGHIIVTSRVRSACVELSDAAEVIEVPEFNKDMAVSLLEAISFTSASTDVLRGEEEREAAEGIVVHLGCLPLAISQAGSFIKRKKSNFKEYFGLLCRNSKKFVFSSFKSSGHVYENGVASCWDLSLEEASHEARRLLNVCAFLANENIPLELLERGLSALEWFKGDTAELSYALNDLVELSLIKRKDIGEAGENLVYFWIHPLLQSWVRDHLEDGVVQKEATTNVACHEGGKKMGENYATTLVLHPLFDSAENPSAFQMNIGYIRRITPHIELSRNYALKAVASKGLSTIETARVAKYLVVLGQLDYRRGKNERELSIQMATTAMELYDKLGTSSDEDSIMVGKGKAYEFFLCLAKERHTNSFFVWHLSTSRA